MQKISTVTTSAVPLPLQDVDTDQIIPARYLKAIDKKGFGKHLFRDWRFNGEEKNNDFVLNNPIYSGNILVAGKNFGCGSSREHAAWALSEYGFQIIISSFFADIFKSNALNNGILPITVKEQDLVSIFKAIEKDSTEQFTVNLAEQSFSFQDQVILFEIDPYKKKCLLNGYDDIDYLLSIRKDIESFEKQQILF